MLIETVGVIGLGKMGMPIAGNVLKAGFKVLGFDVSSDATQMATSKGIRCVSSIAELAATSDLVIVLVALESQVEETLFSEKGVCASSRPGTIVAVGSTIAPSVMRNVAARVEKRGLLALDIPSCRGVEAAEAGALLISGGGSRSAFDACRPVLESFANSIHHLGPAGSGQVGKLINNLTLWACISINTEGRQLGAGYGVDLSILRAMLLDSSAQNWALRNVEENLVLTWAEKDMSMVLDEAEKLHLKAPMSTVVQRAIHEINTARKERAEKKGA